MSIRLRLALMVVSLLLPALAASWWFVNSAYDSEERSTRESLQNTTRALSMVVDRELAKRMTIATLLADSPLLDGSPEPSRADLDRFHDQAVRAMQGTNGWVVVSSNTRQLLNTLLPRDKQRLDVQQGSRARFGFAESAPVLTNLAVGRMSNQLLASVQAPVRRGDTTSLNVGVTVLPAELQRIIDAQGIADGWTAAILDSRGVIAARKPYPDRWVGQPATPELISNSSAKLEGFFDSVTLDGVASVGFFSKSPVYGWTFAMAVPKVAFGSVVRRSLGSMLAIGLVLLCASVLTALWMGKRITGPLSVLRRQAELLTSGKSFPAARTGGVEFDQVSTALATASVKIADARNELEQQVRSAIEETRRTVEQLAQSSRLEALGRLTGGVAHDFNNLLAVIGSNAEVIRLRMKDATPPRQLAAITRAVESGSKLTQHLLRFSRRQAVRPERLRLGSYLPSVSDMFRTVLGATVSVQCEVAADVDDINVDPAEFELALLNLAVNSRDAMAHGGMLTLSAANLRDDQADLRPADLPDVPYVLVTVSDTGEGMPADIVAKVFEPFFTTKSADKGSGLGLSLVFGFCSQAGGTARVIETSSKGTVIGLILPAVTSPRQDAQDAQDVARQATPAGSDAPLTAATAHAKQILLVEDNIDLGDTTAELLASTGYRVARAFNADEALEAIGRQRPDVVLTDVVMPGSMDGLALAQLLCAMREPLPVVVVTGYAESIPDSRGFDVLRKPYMAHDLLAALDQALDRAA